MYTLGAYELFGSHKLGPSEDCDSITYVNTDVMKLLFNNLFFFQFSSK